MLAKVKRKLANWLTSEVADPRDRERIESLTRQVEALTESSRKVGALEDEVGRLRKQVETTALQFTDSNALRLETQRKNAIEQGVTLAPHAVLSDEALIENTRGDKSKITVGDHSYVRGRLLTYGHGGKIEIGEWVYVGARTEIWSMESISIGNRVLISHDVNIHDGTAHSADAEERHKHFNTILTKGHPSDFSELPGVKKRTNRY